MSLVFAGSGFIIISENRYFISKCEFVLAEIGIDFLLDRICCSVRKLVYSFPKMKSLTCAAVRGKVTRFSI